MPSSGLVACCSVGMPEAAPGVVKNPGDLHRVLVLPAFTFPRQLWTRGWVLFVPPWRRPVVAGAVGGSGTVLHHVWWLVLPEGPLRSAVLVVPPLGFS